MGGTKDEMMRREELHHSAVGTLIEVGALEECKYHEGTVYDCDEDKVVDAYKLANARMTQQGATIEQRKEFTDAIKSAYEGNSGNDGCEECRRNFGPD